MPETAQRYKIIGKYIYRASTQEITMGTRQDGSPNVVRQPGPMEKLEVGTVLTDVTPNELAAYGDRLELVTAEEERAAQSSLAETGMPASTFNTEKGVHEPTGSLDMPGQKPQPTGEEVAAMKAGQAEVRKLEREQAEQRAKLDKDMEEARSKAMTDTVERTYRDREQAQARTARPAATPAPATAAPPTPPEPPSTTPPPDEPAGRRQR